MVVGSVRVNAAATQGHKWIDTALSVGISLLVERVLVGTIFGARPGHRLDRELFETVHAV